METMEIIIMTAVSVAIAGGLVLALLMALFSEDQKPNRRRASNPDGDSGGDPMFSNGAYDGLSTIVEVMNQAMEDVGLPKVDFESAKSIFARMPANLREQMDVHLGPNFKEAVAGFLNMHLEMIGKAEEFQARAALFQVQEALRGYQIDVASRFAVQGLDRALAAAKEAVTVLEKHSVAEGEPEKLEQYQKMLQSQAIQTYSNQLAASWTGETLPQSREAIAGIFPVVVENRPEALPETSGPERQNGAESVDGEFEEVYVSGNGSRAKGRERR